MRIHGIYLCEAPKMQASRVLAADDGDDEEDEEDEDEERQRRRGRGRGGGRNGLNKFSASLPVSGMNTRRREVRS
jgi:hypothetical protein